MANEREQGREDGRRVRNRALWRLLAAVVLGLLSPALVWAAKNDATFFDQYRNFSLKAEQLLATVTGWLPFSLAELLIVALAVVLVVAVLLLLRRLIVGPGRLRALFTFLSRVTLFAAVAVFAFYSLWGLNYYAPSLALRMGLDDKPRGVEELKTLNTWLIENANALSTQVDRNADGSIPAIDFSEVAAKVAAEYALTTGRREAAVKPVLLSEPWSYTRISGMFTFFTGEGNINTNNTAAALPYVMAHEMSHRYGIAPEDECNFYAFYILYDSGDPLLRYSGFMMSLIYCQNKLFSADREAWRALCKTYSAELQADFVEYNEHWAQYEGKVAEVSDSVNNGYLQMQGQTDGVKSYGEMVDLMLAWYASRTAA